jgi:hypothetical protein
MIKAEEFRLGNYLMEKVQQKIRTSKCGFTHFEKMAAGDVKDLYPVTLKPQFLEQCGFTENKEYALLPEAREFWLLLPLPGAHRCEIKAYVKNNQECFARAMMNGLVISQNVFHLHQLQNLYYGLCGDEMAVVVK